MNHNIFLPIHEHYLENNYQITNQKQYKMNHYDFYYLLDRNDVGSKRYIRLIAPSLLEAVEVFKTIYEKEKLELTEIIEIL
jgi:hypothetical protein